MAKSNQKLLAWRTADGTWKVLKGEQPSVLAEANATKQRRSCLRQSIRSAFDELLTLLLGTVGREVVIERVQAL